MANAIVDKSEDLAVRIVNLYKLLKSERHENIMSKQLMRAGTSIGANIAEAHNAQSDADFLAKLHIALKECNESLYWIKLLWRTDYMSQKEFDSINSDLKEVYALLKSIIKSIKQKMKK